MSIKGTLSTQIIHSSSSVDDQQENRDQLSRFVVYSSNSKELGYGQTDTNTVDCGHHSWSRQLHRQ